jgi:hypothetical protein
LATEYVWANRLMVRAKKEASVFKKPLLPAAFAQEEALPSLAAWWGSGSSW